MKHRPRTLALKIFLPVTAAEIFFFPFWVWHQHGNELSISVPLANLALTSIGVPIFLCYVGLKFSRETSLIETILIAFFVEFSFVTADFLSYANWGISTKELFHPDSETVALNGAIGVLGLVLIALAFIGTIVVRLIKRNSFNY